jgi:eukaryotic-like serine/threonine-protein kinase
MIGERIGNYVVSEKLGEGGMGEVYLARHPQIGKRVALKILHPELAARQEVVTRFFHEAKAVNDIAHPNIVDILDFGSAPTAHGELVYLVMELLEGTTLTHVVAQGPLEPTRAVRILRQVADALVASHERGIVHRDLKPDNIMLVARGRDPEFVKLLDFGIAKVTNAQGSVTKTRTGMVIGTPTYMSPEQCEGKGDIDHRTDVYALGIVLYELLTGSVPFQGEGYAEVLVKQLTEPPPSLIAQRPSISRYLESVVMKALEKRREDRYATMSELREALANPQAFVESRGGLSGFLPARTSSPTGPQWPAATAPVHSTTLSHGAAELRGPQTVQPAGGAGRLTRKLWFGVLGGVVVVGGVVAIAIAATGGSDPASPPSPSEPVASAPATPPTPEPPAPAPPPAPDPATAPAPARMVTISVASTPPGADVFLAGDRDPRCQTPCAFEAEATAGARALTVSLAGYADARRELELGNDASLSLQLVKKRATASPPRPEARPNTARVGDNTLNPFDN